MKIKTMHKRRNNRRLGPTFGLVLLIGGLLAVSFSAGAKSLPKPNLGPFYNPESKSYFELRYDNIGQTLWTDAVRAVSQLSYKGVPGRLAIVRTFATHNFLREHFRLKQPAWIGLHLDCRTGKLIWSDGKVLQPNGPNLWQQPWYRIKNYTCAAQRSNVARGQFLIMPVAYTPTTNLKNAKAKSPFRWWATGPHKGYPAYFVEYPTGKK